MRPIDRTKNFSSSDSFTNTAVTVFRILTAVFTVSSYFAAVFYFRIADNRVSFIVLTASSVLHLILVLFAEPLTYKKGSAANLAVNGLIALCCGMMFFSFKSYLNLIVFLTNIILAGLKLPIAGSIMLVFIYYGEYLAVLYNAKDARIPIFLDIHVLILSLSLAYICHYFSSIENEKIRQDNTIMELMEERAGLSRELEDRNTLIEQSRLDTLDTLIDIIEERDNTTGGHSVKVCKYSVKLAKRMGLGEDEIADIMKAAILHDIGKIGISDNILLKPGALTQDEYEKIMHHPEIGCRILSKVKNMENVIPLVLCHHERVDGGGYPNRLSGDRIPIGAKIIAIADSYDAMTSNRPYRKGLPKREARSRLLSGEGKQFDPELVEKFIEILDSDNVEDIRNYKFEGKVGEGSEAL